MNYIYDIYLNFKNVPYDFFEWNKKDNLTHLKKVPIIKINSKAFNDICFNKIQINNELLKKIEYKTEIWKSKKNIKYCSLFCTNNSILAICFDDNGISYKKSFLYVDEEIEIEENSLNNIKEYKLTYKIKSKKIPLLKTRKEKYEKKFIINMLENIDYRELKYVYFECYEKTDSKKIMINELKNISYNDKNFKNLYNTLKLISTIKK